MDTTNPFDTSIERARRMRERDLQRITEQAGRQFDTTEREINERFSRLQAEQERAGMETMQATKRAMSFSGMGRSTFSAEQQAKVQEVVNSNNANIAAQREAELAKAQAIRDNAPAEVIASYDSYIN